MTFTVAYSVLYNHF